MFLTGNHGARVGEAIGLAAVALHVAFECLVPGSANAAFHLMRSLHSGEDGGHPVCELNPRR